MEWRVFFAVIFTVLALGAIKTRAPFWAGGWTLLAAIFWGAAA